MTTRAARYDALVALMALPDPPELQGLRCARRLSAGVPAKQDRLRRDLQRAWLSWRMYDAGKAESAVVSVRYRMRVLRRGSVK